MTRLSRYWAKRDFDQTPEPKGGESAALLARRYSMQRHAATRLHHDLRLEHDGVLLSFAVTRGPSLDPDEKRLAVRTEDHPIDYLDFEGVIPEGNYGAGTVMLWDIGHWQPFHDVEAGLANGHLHFRLHGVRLGGNWSLVRIGNGSAKVENWLMIKEDDAAAKGPDPVQHFVTGVGSGRNLDEIAAGTAPKPAGPVRRRKAPAFVSPQLAEAGTLPAEDGRHWAELKLDGYRVLASLGQDGVRMFTRNGHDWTERFEPIARVLEALPASNALIDTEIVAGAGLQGFGALQSAISAGGPFRLVVFDLLHLDGRDLTHQPLSKRRTALEMLFADQPPLGLLRMSPVIESGWQDALDLICREGGEGLVIKRMDAPYRSGRGAAWRKVKCIKSDSFVVVGWEPSTSRGRPFGALLLAEPTDSSLVYRGRVGTGFDQRMREEIAQRLAPLAVDIPPLEASNLKDARWVRPRLQAEVRFTEITSAGHLRHPVFTGLRDDLAMPHVADTSREKILGVGR